MRFPMAVDSPPGTMSPARPWRSSTPLTSTGSTPSFSRICACSRKAPWSASTPILFGLSRSAFRAVTLRVSPLPATRRQPLPLRKISHLPADHSLAQALARLADYFRISEVGRSLHYRFRPPYRIPALKDTAPDEDAVRPKLHHQRGIGGGRDPPGREQHDRQMPVLGNPLNQIVGRPKLLRLRHQFLFV